MKTGAFDQQGAVVRAVGVRSLVTGYVADVDVVQAGVQGLVARPLQRDGRGGRQVAQAVQRREAAEVQRGVLAQVVAYPYGHAPDHGQVVVEGGDQQIGHLQPHAFLALGHQGVQHRLQGRAVDPPVEAVVEGLEVGVTGVDHPAQLLQRLPVDIAGGDEHVAHAGLMRQLRGVVHVLVEHDGIGVGVGDGAAVLRAGERDQFGRFQFQDGLHLLAAALRQLPVLAVEAVQVAAGGGHREHRRGGVKVIQGLLFHRVDVDGGWPPVGGGHQSSAQIDPYPAVAGCALGDHAAAWTEFAGHLTHGYTPLSLHGC